MRLEDQDAERGQGQAQECGRPWAGLASATAPNFAQARAAVVGVAVQDLAPGAAEATAVVRRGPRGVKLQTTRSGSAKLALAEIADDAVVDVAGTDSLEADGSTSSSCRAGSRR